METRKKRLSILAIDSLGALVVGCLTWMLAPLLQSLHKWSLEFAQFIATANFGYGLYSGALYLLFRRVPHSPGWLLAVLVAANGLWTFQCLFQAWRLRAEASYLGLGHLVFEAAYVGCLAYIEARIFSAAVKNRKD